VDDLSGQTVKGYEITERIGAGNFGAVYRACQVSVAREVAVKVILPDYANHPDFIRRFETEAQLVARLEHPHIVPLFDYWREPDCAYLVMRLLPHNLRLRLEEGPLGFQEVAQLVDQITSALAMSHRQGVVHRDIKPDNILLDVSGNAYLTDFGLAKVMSLQDDEEGVTGSPAYMSPEQLTSDPLTPQSDMYALGVVIYELLTGLHPFRDLNISDLIAKHLLEPLPFNTALPDTVNAVIQQATAKDPQERYPDMLVLANEFRQALLGERETLVPVTSDLPVENPYKGLRAFEEADSSDFFGREDLVEQLVGSLAEPGDWTRFLAVIGPSGSGKSSLVKAGLIPALRAGAVFGSDRWFILSMVPGAHPGAALEAALLRVAARPVDHLRAQLETDRRGLVVAAQRVLEHTGDDLLLVLDQFEEVFTLVEDEAERAHFLALLHTAVTDPDSRVRVIVTLRADYYDRPLLYEEFGALVRARTVVVLPLTSDELERAIVEPAQRVGVQVEPNLVAAIMADVRSEPGALPLLQYALTEVFERRQGRLMTMEGYEAINRAAGALARRAERVYQRLSPDEQAITRQVFLRLVTLGEGTGDMRRRANQSELVSIAPDLDTLQEVLDIFGRHRLLSFDHVPATREPTVEIAHEALIREWGRLRDWLDDSREDVRQQRRLAGLVAEWLDAGQDPSYLLRGVQLEQFEHWEQASSLALTDDEWAFLAASIQVREDQRAQELARQQRVLALEARARRFLRVLLVVMAVAMVIALALSLLAFDQREEARRNAELAGTEAASAATAASVAQLRADEIQALALADDGQRALDSGDVDLALTLALEANRVNSPPVQAQLLLGEIVPAAAVRVLETRTPGINTVALSPDGTQVVSGGENGTLIVWDLASGKRVQTLAGHGDRVRDVTFTPDGTRVISGGDDARLIVWNLATGTPVRTLTGHDDDIFSVAVSPDGTQVASGSRDRTIILWDLATGRIVRRFGTGLDGHLERVTAVAFSPDGQTILSGSADHTLILWDVASGDRLGLFTGHNDAVTDVAFSPNGRTALSASADKTLILWEIATQAPISWLRGHTERITSLAFSPDGRQAVSGAGNPFAGSSTDNSLILWDVYLGQPVQRYTGHSLQVTDVAYSADGQTLVSASADGTLRLWAAGFDIELAHARAADRRFSAVAFDETGNQALVALAESGLMLIPVSAEGEPRLLSPNGHAGLVNAVALSPDGTQVLTASADRTLILWDIATGDELQRLRGHTNAVNDVVFLPDGTRALSASRDRSLILWDLATGEALRTFQPLHTNEITAVALSPDGTMAISASTDSTLIVWDVETGAALRTLRGHQGGVTDVTFSPDGQRALSGSLDESLILWDVENGLIVRRFGTGNSGHTDWITAVAFSPDGQLAVSGSRDRTVRVWDVATAQEIRRYDAFTDSVLALRPTADGRALYAASAEGMVRLLPFTTPALVDWITTHRYVRLLTCIELEQYRLGQCD
jgi:WD40 repeat protein/serine/threonine protein kinase